MTTVEKEQFWTQIVNNPFLWGTIQTSDKSFNTQAENIWTVMNDTFIINGSLKEVSRWEIMLGEILENSGKGTLTERKARILKRITEHPLITKGTLKESLEKLVSEKFGYIFESAYDKYTDTFDFKIACQEIDKEDINNLISNTIPKVKNVNLEYEDIFKYSECKTVAEISAINADYSSDMPNGGEWIYPLLKLENGTQLFKGNSNLKKINIELPKVTNAYEMFGNCPNLIEWGINELPKVTNVDYFLKAPLKKFKCKFPALTKFYGSIMNCISLERSEIDAPNLLDGAALHRGCSKLKHFRCTLDNLVNGNNMLDGCILDKESTLHVLTTIPMWNDGVSHNLTIGIHIDNQNDEDVITAISNAEENGWTLTVQWNGTATAQQTTYSMRGRNPIYAKKSEMKTLDGSKDILDWGHYITNWEENGYQEFSSLEEAYEYFGIEPEL